jgi:hypothetical protein
VKRDILVSSLCSFKCCLYRYNEGLDTQAQLKFGNGHFYGGAAVGTS